MGYPLACQVIILPNFLLQFLTAIAIIRSSILKLLGLSYYLDAADEVLPGSPPPRPVSVIRESLPVVKFSEIECSAGKEKTSDSCAVCLVEFKAEHEIRWLTNCTHVFHRCCVDRWMDHYQTTCPLCGMPFILADAHL